MLGGCLRLGFGFERRDEMVVGNPDFHLALLRDEEPTHLAHVGVDTPDDIPIQQICVSFEHSSTCAAPLRCIAQAEGQVRTTG